MKKLYKVFNSNVMNMLINLTCSSQQDKQLARRKGERNKFA